MVDTAPILAIEARTTEGTGLTLPIAKGMSHLNVVALIHAHEEWPLTAKGAATEITAAVEHFSGMVAPEPLLSPEGFEAINGWRTSTIDELNEVARIARTTGDDEPLADDLFNIVIQVITSCWNILAAIDREITGITFADPGTKP